MTRTLLAALLLSSALLASQRAEACGCFTPPNPTVPVVQAGERILFSVDHGQVTAHVQVQYSGGDADFGWLLPLPSVPTLELGSDEIFARLQWATQPTYQLDTVFDSWCRPFGFSGGGGAATGGGTGFGGSADAGVAGGPSPLVVEDSVGPYDYAVLHADSKDAMLTWLADNHYFVPAGTDSAVTPYIQPGAYFLALKLHPGNSTGDLQPVVLHYASDVGTIPLTLTATGAEKNMGVQVWMLGEGRAIPRNYAHTVLNDAAIDWQSRGSNYNDLVIRAVGEAPGKHTFVTEYAGSSVPTKNALLPVGRFGTKSALAAQPTAQDFINYLYNHSFTAPTLASPFQFTFSAAARSVLARSFPPPAGVNVDTFLANYAYFVARAPPQNYQPVELADALWPVVVEPVEKAALLFDETRTLTRLYSTISPEDMNRDPSFSFNPALSPVNNVHVAVMQVRCDATGNERSAQLRTEQGWQVNYSNGRFSTPDVATSLLPASLLIELLREEGPSVRLFDGTVKIASQMDTVLPVPTPTSQSCSSTGGLLALAAVGFWVRRRR